MARISGVNLPKAKRQNEITIKEILYKYGPIERTRIVDMMGLTLPTITTNIAELIAQGFAHEVESYASCQTLGRRARPVDIAETYRYVVGIEVAPYRYTFCTTDLRLGHMKSEVVLRANDNYEEMVDFVARRVEMMTADLPREKIAGVGIGVPGFVERKTGVIRRMGRFNWINKPLGDDLSQRLNLPVCVENNVRVRVIGEDMLYGRNRPDTFAYFFVSLGVACPLMIKNSLFSGQSAGAGEIGHMIMQPDGPLCKMCGKNGCLDSIASDEAVINRCRSTIDMGSAQILEGFVRQSGELTMKEVLKAQQTGDPVICAIVQQAVHHLAIALANVINFMSPNLVVVDAYVMNFMENRDAFIRTVDEYLYGLNNTEVTIEFKDYDPLYGCKGAAAFAVRQFVIRQ